MWVIWDRREDRVYVELPLVKTKREADRELAVLLEGYAPGSEWPRRLATKETSEPVRKSGWKARVAREV